MQRTLYEVLGISTRATAVEVKAAYRRKVLVHHPDVQQKGAGTEEFLACRHAYEVLTDLQQRALYDQQLQAAAQGKARPAPGATHAGPGPRRGSASPGPPACMGAASAATAAPPPHSALALAATAAAAAGWPHQTWQRYAERYPVPGDCPSMAELRELLLQECGAVVEDFQSVQEAMGALPWDGGLHTWYSAAASGPDCLEAQRQQQQQQQQQVPWAGSDHAQLWNWLQEQHQHQQQPPC